MRQITDISIAAAVALLCILSAGCEAGGSAERVSPYRLAPQPPEAVELYLDGRQPDRPFELIALVESEARTRRFVTMQEAEAAALDKIRNLAAKHGARAVIDIEQSISHDDGTGQHIVRVRGKAIAFRK